MSASAETRVRAAIRIIDRLEADNRRMTAEVARLREALTPSAETKAAYNGEFTFPLNGYDPPGTYVPWTTVKEIMVAILARAALPKE